MVAVPVANPFFVALMSGVDLPDLADLVDRPAFMADALCRERPEVEFFPVRGVTLEPARAVCRRCLVRAECLTYAVETDQGDGVWAGTSAKQRRRALREGWTVADVLAELDSRTGD